MKTKYIIFAVIGIVILGIAYYLISPLFRNVRVDETAQNAEVLSGPAEVQETPTHPASGTATIVEMEGKKYLRYENFKTINGPDLFVYLAKDIDAKEFVNLGNLKATEGNVNYEIPPDVNHEEYPYALVWCRAFRVLFNSAKFE